MIGWRWKDDDDDDDDDGDDNDEDENNDENNNNDKDRSTMMLIYLRGLCNNANLNTNLCPKKDECLQDMGRKKVGSDRNLQVATTIENIVRILIKISVATKSRATTTTIRR